MTRPSKTAKSQKCTFTKMYFELDVNNDRYIVTIIQ